MAASFVVPFGARGPEQAGERGYAAEGMAPGVEGGDRAANMGWFDCVHTLLEYPDHTEVVLRFPRRVTLSTDWE